MLRAELLGNEHGVIFKEDNGPTIDQHAPPVLCIKWICRGGARPLRRSYLDQQWRTQYWGADTVPPVPGEKQTISSCKIVIQFFNHLMDTMSSVEEQVQRHVTLNSNVTFQY
jgi:hypothetical protein